MKAIGKRRLDEGWNKDEFVTWLGFANAGMLCDGNVFSFDYALSNMPAKSSAAVVEIGSFCGLSTNAIGHYMRKHHVTAPLFTCDRWLFENANAGKCIAGSPLTHDEYRKYVVESFHRNVNLFSRSRLPHTIEAYSDEFFDLWRKRATTTDVFGRSVTLGGAIGFCYIDGNHTYDFAHRDFVNTDEFLIPGGFILFDDSADESGWDVRRVIAEVLRSGKYEKVIDNPNYLVRKKL